MITFFVWFHYDMHIISRKAFLKFGEIHNQAIQPLDDWFRLAKTAEWQNLSEVKNNLPSADLAGECVIFNIGGNKFRLITKISYLKQLVFVRFVLTHADYDKGVYKNDCKC